MKNYDDRGGRFTLSDSEASQDNTLSNLNSYLYGTKAEFIYLTLSSQMPTIPTFSGIFVFKPQTFDHVNYSFFSSWLAFEITGQSVSCSLALQSRHFFVASFVQCFYSFLEEWPKYFKFGQRQH